MSTIGERIKQRRIELNMSQDELAKKVGYSSRSTINKIELGNNDLRQGKIKAFADALLTTTDYIMGWENEEHTAPQYNSKYFELIKGFEKLSDNNKKVVLDLIHLLEEH